VESDVPRPAFVLDILDKELKNYPNNHANLRLGWFFCSKRYQETKDVTDLNKGIELIEIALPALEEGRRKSGFSKALEQWKREREQVEMERFDAAMQAYKERSFEESISRFQAFLQSLPKSKLADDALFWIGESFLSLRHYDKAISAYQEAMDKYPEGDRLPNAMLRQALAFDMKEDKISSRLILKDILGKYPQSNEADVARQRLRE
jgi:tol-pal system protein YbgF